MTNIGQCVYRRAIKDGVEGIKVVSGKVSGGPVCMSQSVGGGVPSGALLLLLVGAGLVGGVVVEVGGTEKTVVVVVVVVVEDDWMILGGGGGGPSRVSELERSMLVPTGA